MSRSFCFLLWHCKIYNIDLNAICGIHNEPILNGKNAEELARKVIEILNPYKKIIHTITGDNRKEFAEYKIISSGLYVDFYFARTYHSLERGTNENTNGLIRQYFPKG